MREVSDPNYLFLYDHNQRLVAISPELIKAIYPTKEREQCLMLFHGEEAPRVFNHSLYDIVIGLDTFYNANK
jgi:hypothetical protein